MAIKKEEISNILETVISIFTIDKGIVKVLLVRKKADPYKGYWILPGNVLKNDEQLEENILDAIYNRVGIENVYLEQCHVFSKLDRDPSDRVIAVSFMGLIDQVSVKIKMEERATECEWFKIDAIPKMAYDHEEIVMDAINHLRTKLNNLRVLKLLFPSDFALPEIQKVYEQILGKKLDRRNFRKKFINLDIIEYTGYKNEGGNGRPAKLYRFKEEVEEKNIF